MNTDRWWAERYIGDGTETEHGEEICDHRYFIRELNTGWQWTTPAGRIEIVTLMEPVDRSEYWWRIWTDKTGPNWSWRLRAQSRVNAIPRFDQAAPHLRFLELSGSRTAGGSWPSMHIVPASPSELIPDFAMTLCEARYGGPGAGWTVTDRPDGGDETRTTYPSKAKARTALLTAGRHHAKILGLRLVKEGPE